MVDLHKVETYDDTSWHVRLWLYSVDKTTFGNWFSSCYKDSWRAEDNILECIPKGFCAYWWGLILYCLVQVPVTIVGLFIVTGMLVYAPLMGIALLCSGVDIYSFANVSKDFIINISCAVLILYGFAICVGSIMFLIKKFIDADIIDKISDGVAQVEVVKTCNKLYEAHKQKYCPMIVINKTQDKDKQ
jgi:hypothetical protein